MVYPIKSGFICPKWCESDFVHVQYQQANGRLLIDTLFQTILLCSERAKHLKKSGGQKREKTRNGGGCCVFFPPSAGGFWDGGINLWMPYDAPCGSVHVCVPIGRPDDSERAHFGFTPALVCDSQPGRSGDAFRQL